MTNLLIKHHFPEENIPSGRAGRKPVPTRKVFEGTCHSNHFLNSPLPERGFCTGINNFPGQELSRRVFRFYRVI